MERPSASEEKEGVCLDCSWKKESSLKDFEVTILSEEKLDERQR